MDADHHQEEAKRVLTEKLLSMGAHENEVDQIITDVTEIIAEKFVEKYGTDSQLTPEHTQEKFQEVAQEVWADYFKYMETT